MESLLFRTGSGSIPVQTPSASPTPHTPAASLPVRGSSAFPGEPISLRTEIYRREIRRCRSGSDVSRSEVVAFRNLGSRSLQTPEADREELNRGFAGDWGGGGMDGKWNSGGGAGGGAEKSEIGAYYRKMLEPDPSNFLLLTNYGRYLHEVERESVKAEEYYGRAILSSPGVGEALSLYGKLIGIKREMRRELYLISFKPFKLLHKIGRAISYLKFI
ncbi:tetratricopeptide repeat protein [Striga asiatica]|uniref:Tetratricopeptide repeat protein n=1 Tax=Striga asiatica TaxID=4170 RepID=A0A5A7PS41_STRAF|nr:tetratricopeptide repeat protein [Striga asiatica]